MLKQKSNHRSSAKHIGKGMELFENRILMTGDIGWEPPPIGPFEIGRPVVALSAQADPQRAGELAADDSATVDPEMVDQFFDQYGVDLSPQVDNGNMEGSYVRPNSNPPAKNGTVGPYSPEFDGDPGDPRGK